MSQRAHSGRNSDVNYFAAPDFNGDYAERPTQPHRIEVTGEAEEHFRRWLEIHSEDATRRHRHTQPHATA